MSLENPYRHGAYHFTVATLIAMGLNKSHKFEAFVARFKKTWLKADVEGFKAFVSKPARNEATARDLDGRIYQNCRVLQRTKDYGKPLLKAGAVIDLTRDDKGVLHICLSTKSKKPLKPGRGPKASKPEAKPAKSKPKTTRKATGGRKRAQKRTVKDTDAIPATLAAAESPKAVTEEPAKSN